MDDIVLTFCIPSYNRVEKTVATVQSILDYHGNDIEVVVTDNCSSDDTVERIKDINDSRLHIRVNSENIGASANFMESLRYGSGKYKFVILSRETVISEKISDLISFLKEKEYSLVYCGQDGKDGENEIFESGADAIKHFGYRDLHPTGYIFNSRMIMDIIKDVEPDKCNDLYRNFPHEFWAAELAIKGNTALYNKRIRVRVNDKYMKEVKSAFRDSGKQVWFFPDEQIEQFKLYLKHLSKLDINSKLKSEIVGRCYLDKLFASTYGFKIRMKDEIVCNHYNIVKKDIAISEMLHYSTKLKEAAMIEIGNNNLHITLSVNLEISSSGLIMLMYPLLSKLKHIIFR